MKLVLGYNGSNSSKKALALVQKYAQNFNATVYILASLTGEKTPPEIASLVTSKAINEEVDVVKEMESRLEFAQKTLAKEGIICETHMLIRGLEPGEDIVKFAKEVDADFIVMGIGKTSRVGKLFFGSNAQYTILEASCPVVTVK
jgi:nucleotide-binding universal stress UspA family protein